MAVRPGNHIEAISLERFSKRRLQFKVSTLVLHSDLLDRATSQEHQTITKVQLLQKITLRFAIWEQELSSKSIQKRPLPQVIFNSYTRKPIEKAHPEEISLNFIFCNSNIAIVSFSI